MHNLTRAAGARDVTVAATGDHFERDGQPWFALSDTIWSAFTHVPEDDWERYIEHRVAQGFGALNISILPILHDLSARSGSLPSPFDGFWSGAPRFGALATDYVVRARGFLDLAVARGLVPNLVVLWCNYVPETWASKDDPRYVMPAGARPDYVSSVVEAFGRYAPMWVVAGDGDFASLASQAAWSEAQAALLDGLPGAVTTMHTQDTAVVPPALAADAHLGYYSYQSGHQLGLQPNAWHYATHYESAPVRRPIVNLEPCYEGHQHGFGTGRHGAADVRRASWQSLLSGASAGLGYGAHGVWDWHERGAAFNHEDFSGTPFAHETALAFSGADDVVAAARLMTAQGLIGARSAQEVLVDPPDGFRAARSRDGDRLAVYLPYAAAVRIAPDVEYHGAVMHNLADGRIAPAEHGPGDRHRLRQPEWNADTLLVMELEGDHA